MSPRYCTEEEALRIEAEVRRSEDPIYDARESYAEGTLTLAQLEQRIARLIAGTS